MKTLNRLVVAEYEKDGSKFLAHLAPAKSADSLLGELQEKHKKAVHFVRASRMLNEFSQIVESSSDDGEPKGSSGVPVLNVLRGKELIECVCIVVRYFGGKLLGVGGLVRAYSNATLLAVENAQSLGEIVEFIPRQIHKISLPFNAINHAKYLSTKMGANILNIVFLSDNAEITIECEDKVFAKFIATIGAKSTL